MSTWCCKLAVVMILACQTRLSAYDDDDLLCRPGWSPELLQQQLWDQHQQQVSAYYSQQAAMVQSMIAEQRAQEKIRAARQAKADKAARKRADLIAKRRAEATRRVLVTQRPLHAVAGRTASKQVAAQTE